GLPAFGTDTSIYSSGEPGCVGVERYRCEAAFIPLQSVHTRRASIIVCCGGSNPRRAQPGGCADVQGPLGRASTSISSLPNSVIDSKTANFCARDVGLCPAPLLLSQPPMTGGTTR